MTDEESVNVATDESGRDHADAAQEMTQAMMDAAGLDTTTTVTAWDAEGVDLLLEGEDAALLIGKHGQTLNALQHVLGLMLRKRLDRHVRITVDAENYRARRAESLIQIAKTLAAQVRAAQQEAVMDPLNAAERRIVHTALMEEEGVTTYSEGEEPQRRVVISPAA